MPSTRDEEVEARLRALEARATVQEAALVRQSNLLTEIQGDLRIFFSANAHRLEDIADALEKLKGEVSRQ